MTKHLIKLATVIQRIEAIKLKEKDQRYLILNHLQDLLEESNNVQDEVKNISEEDTE